MSATINKRQQARNERTLQLLITTVPGNDRCADCAAKNPGWASWSLGIFLCMRCAAMHRKLGTHISKVKSLSMDTWNLEQVERMKQVGNIISNRVYNPKSTKPAIPIDIDEVDGVMERFIRQKYEQKTLSSGSESGSRQHTGSTSSEDRAPPPPPKPTKHFRFGLRSATATFPVSRHERSPPLSPLSDELNNDRSPPRNKPAKILGVADIGSSRDDNIKAKLTQLRDMGFPDEKRNIAVLKGLNGRVDKAVEELIRLGEGGSSNRRTSRGPASSAPRGTAATGLNVEKARPSQLTSSRGLSFEDMQKSLPPSPLSPDAAAVPMSLNRAVSPAVQTNPFMQQQTMQSMPFGLDQSMQQMSLSQPNLQPPSQLFPNSTGGHALQNQGHNPFMQGYPAQPQQQNVTYQAPAVQPYMDQTQVQYNQSMPPPQQRDVSNPFLRTSKSQVFASSSNPFGASSAPHVQPYQQTPQYDTQQQYSQPQLQPQATVNPFQQAQAFQQIPQQSPFQPQQQNTQSFWQNSQAMQQPPQTTASPPPMTTSPPPFQQMNSAMSSYQYPAATGYPLTDYSQHQTTYPPVKHDKTSILALYGAPSPSVNGATSFASPNDFNATSTQPQRSVTMPPTFQASNSPFQLPPSQSTAAIPSSNPFGPTPSSNGVTSSYGQTTSPAVNSGASIFGSNTNQAQSSPFAATTVPSDFTSQERTSYAQIPQPQNYAAPSPFASSTYPSAAPPPTNQLPQLQPSSTTSPFSTLPPKPSPFAPLGASSPFTPSTAPSPFASASQQASSIMNGTYSQQSSNSPFGAAPSAIAASGPQSQPNYRDSVAFNNMVNMNLSGRHSPDAFASLSSRMR